MKRKDKKGVKKITRFAIINSRVAGIDVSEKTMDVAYPVNEKEIEIRGFDTFTEDLHELVGVLKRHDIVSVAMESTGVYWIPLFLLSQENGIEACPVNAAHVKNVTGA